MTARNSEIVRFGQFTFTPGDGLRHGTTEVPLPPRALGVLETLLARPGMVVSKQELMDAVWPDSFVTESSLLEAIGVLRDALSDDRRAPTFIQTVHRRGYRFVGTIGLEPQAPSLKPSSFFSGPEWRPLNVVGALALLATIAMPLALAVFGQLTIARPISRYSIALPSGAPIDPLRGSIAVSADGSRVVYVANGDSGSQLFMRAADRDEAAAIDSTENATGPFFSPDGEWIGFFANGSLQRVRTTGGLPIMICAARAGAGATWSADGTIILGGGPGGGLARVPATGGEPVVLAAPEPGSREVRYGWPDLLPGGRGILFTSISVAGSDVRVLDLRSGRRSTIVPDAAFGRYSPTGHLIFEQRGHLQAAPFSLANLTTTDAPRSIVSRVSIAGPLDGPSYAFSRTGALVYVPRDSSDDDASLHWLDRFGQLERVPLPAARVGGVDLAPDRRRLAMSVDGDTGPELWLGDLAQGDLRRFTNDAPSVSPAWRPNGLEIAFAFSKAGPFNLYMKPVNGGETTRLIGSPWNQFPTSWSPDGRQLAFTEFQPLTGADIWVLDVDTRARRSLVRTLFDETWARFSPDGRWVIYMSNESGRWEVYARDSAGAGPRLRVSSTGGVWPCWSTDGRTVYYNAGGRTLASVLSNDEVPSFSEPSIVVGADAMMLAGGGTASDRLLVRHAGTPSTGRTELRVILAWFTELTRIVQAG